MHPARWLPYALIAVLAGGCGHRAGGPSAPAVSDAPLTPAVAGVVINDSLPGLPIFPSDNWWKLDIRSAPLDPGSDAYIDFVSGRINGDTTSTQRMHPDFGPPPYGIPYVGVSGTQPLMPVTYVLYGNQSDAGAPGQPPGFPIPLEAQTIAGFIEGNVPGGGPSGDRHLLIVDRDHGFLFETWATRWNSSAGRWEAGSGAVFDLHTNARRPDGWTSADAAGFAILPGLVRWDEAYGTGEIQHALRVTVRATNGYVWPASHVAGSTPGALPMGARLRMKASKNISGYPAAVQRIFRAMKTYGIMVADNGTDLYVSGTMDGRWDNDILNPAFHSVTADDFEVVQLGWQPVASVP